MRTAPDQHLGGDVRPSEALRALGSLRGLLRTQYIGNALAYVCYRRGLRDQVT